MVCCPWWKNSKIEEHPVVEEVKEHIEDLAEDVQEHVEDFIEEIKEDVQEHVEDLVEEVKDDIEEFVEEVKDDVDEIVTEFVDEAVDEVKENLLESITRKDIEENEVVTEMHETREEDLITETAESLVEESMTEGLNNATELIMENDDKVEMPEVNNDLDNILGTVRTKNCDYCKEENIFYNTNDAVIPNKCHKCKYKYMN